MHELHRHVGGSISANTVWNILQLQKKHNHYKSLEHVIQKLTFCDGDEYDFQVFLRKFDILDTIAWDAQAISIAFEQICRDVYLEGIKYCELKLTINKYVQHTNWTDEAVIKFIYDKVQEQKKKYGIEIVLVLCLKYESDRHRQKEIANLINNPEIADKLVGIDLVGNEEFFDVDFYESIFDDWRKAGKGLQAHVGESQGVENVRFAIERLGVQRLAHGIRILEDESLISIIKERNICFDIALTSNLYTGVVTDIKSHPVLRLLDVGCSITIGTDDPTVLNTNLDKEYNLLSSIGVDSGTIEKIKENSAKYAFKK